MYSKYPVLNLHNEPFFPHTTLIKKAKHILFDRRTVVWPFTISCIILIVAGLLMLAFQQADNKARSDILNLNLTLEARLNDGLINNIQKDMLSLAKIVPEQIYQQQSTVALTEKLDKLTHLFPDLTELEILGMDHNVHYRSSPNRNDLTSPVHYGKLLDPQNSNVNEEQIGPVMLFHESGRTHLHFALQVTGQHGSTLGWLVSTLHLASMKRLFEEVNVGPNGTVFLHVTDESDTLLIHSASANTSNSSGLDYVKQQLLNGVDQGFFNSKQDGVERLYGFKRVGGYPLVIVTGLATTDYLADLHYIVAAIVGLGLVLIFLILKFNHRLKLTRQRELMAVDELRSSEEHNRLLLHSMGHAIFGIDYNGLCTFSNLNCAQMFGFENPEQMIGVYIDSHFCNPRGDNRNLVCDIFQTLHKGSDFHCDSCNFVNNQHVITPVEIRAYSSNNKLNSSTAVITIQDVSVRKEQERKIAYMAYHDALTGLPNRWLLNEMVTTVIAGAQHDNETLALLYIDLDNFKNINDSLGHIAGDALLKTIANRFVDLQPAIDTVARLGGDEYLILVRHIRNRRQLQHLLDDIITQVQQPVTLEGHSFSVTPSIGVALYPDHGDSFEMLLKTADMALYKAKGDGRNTYRFYTTIMGEEGLKRLTIESELRLAFELGQLSVHYQPQIDLDSGQVIGAEALLRWNHPEKGYISPSEFIPVAEASGLIIPISNWLLEQVCQQIVQWRQDGMAEIVIAINCSAVQLIQGDLVAETTRVLADYGVNPACVEFELTESMLVEESAQLDKIIAGLKTLGIKLSIDDFGTGYSNLAYLKKFAVNKLKIDQSFIRGMHLSSDDHAIVQAIITLAHNFNLRVIAEGVELETTLSLLKSQGCDEVQGYYFSRPVAAAEFAHIMANINNPFKEPARHYDAKIYPSLVI